MCGPSVTRAWTQPASQRSPGLVIQMRQKSASKLSTTPSVIRFQLPNEVVRGQQSLLEAVQSLLPRQGLLSLLLCLGVSGHVLGYANDSANLAGVVAHGGAGDEYGERRAAARLQGPGHAA